MSTLTLTPKLQITQPPAAPIRSKSLTGVLWGKVLSWIEEASFQALLKAGVRCIVVASTVLLVFTPQFFLGYLTAALHWNSFRIPIFCSCLALIMNGKRIWTWTRRRMLRTSKGNQHTIEGLSVSDLANFLTETQSFKKEDAQKRLALSHGQWYKIAESLEKYGILYRGESNARILRPIDRLQLAMQLQGLAEKKYPPLVWDETRQEWYERDGSFAQFCLGQEWNQKKMEENIERKERKVERIEKKLSEASAFDKILNMAV